MWLFVATKSVGEMIYCPESSGNTEFVWTEAQVSWNECKSCGVGFSDEESAIYEYCSLKCHERARTCQTSIPVDLLWSRVQEVWPLLGGVLVSGSDEMQCYNVLDVGTFWAGNAGRVVVGKLGWRLARAREALGRLMENIRGYV